MANIKFSQFTQKTTLGTVDFLVGYTGAQNIQIDPVDLLSSYPTGSGGTGRVAFWEPSNNISSDYLFKWDNSSNKLGIGVENPISKVHVKDDFNNSSQIGLEGNTPDYATVRVENDNTTIGSYASLFLRADTGDSRIAAVKKSNASNDVDIVFMLDDTSASACVERLRIVGDTGNVGIGTTTPSAKLHVDGTLIATGISQLGSGGSNVLLTSSSAGNVGIGTSSPSTKLHVTGIIQSVESGNAAFYGGDYVRLFNNQNFRFRNSGGTVVANIGMSGNSYFNGGNVGIGTTSPESKLHIVDSNASTQLRLNQTGNNDALLGSGTNFFTIKTGEAGANNALSILHSNQYVGIGTTSPVEKLQINSGDVLINNSTVSSLKSGGSLYIDLNTFGSYSGRNFRILDNGTSLVNVKQTGEVGIGTTSPGQKLEVAGRIRVTTDPTIEFYEASNKRGGIQWDITNDYTNIFAVGGDIRFDAGAERMRITSAGNVGIGTTSPSYKLDINGEIKSDGYRIDLSATTQRAITSTGTDSIQFGDSGVNEFKFKNAAGTSMIINSSGNVGIGTTSPADKLDVAGNIRWTGDATNAGGGNLIMGGGQIKFSDAGRLFMGDSNDLQIYHDGSNSYIDDSGTGTLRIRSNFLTIEKYNNGEIMASFDDDNAVSLYHDNSKKFETTSTGIKISGQMDLAALNSAPSSASDTGVTGEIRFTADYIYVCVGTNTWKRAALSTW